VDSGFHVTPNTRFTSLSDEGVEDVNARIGANARELRRDENPDGPGDSFKRRNSADVNVIDDSMKPMKERKERLRLLILTMLRMSIDCPFADVRHSFNKCLNRLRVRFIVSFILEFLFFIIYITFVCLSVRPSVRLFKKKKKKKKKIFCPPFFVFFLKKKFYFFFGIIFFF